MVLLEFSYEEKYCQTMKLLNVLLGWLYKPYKLCCCTLWKSVLQVADVNLLQLKALFLGG